MGGMMTTPLSWAFWLLVIGLAAWVWCRRRKRPLPKWPFVASAAAAVVSACPLVSIPLSRAWIDLGQRWPNPPAWVSQADPEVIVVLGGGLRAEGTAEVDLNPASRERLLAGLEAARRWPQAKLLLSGGNPMGRPLGVARKMADEALALGFDPGRLLVEEKSRNTWENAAFSAGLIRNAGWSRVVVLSSPEHLARARDSFRRLGIESAPLASGPAPEWEPTLGLILPDVEALEWTTSVLHEMIGLAWYRLAR